MAHTTVRVIVRQDLPHNKGYEGDVVEVKPGYARNYLIPQKMAVYATRQNFLKLGLNDPAGKQKQSKEKAMAAAAAWEAGDGAVDDKDLKAADLLRYYLRNKTVRDC